MTKVRRKVQNIRDLQDHGGRVVRGGREETSSAQCAGEGNYRRHDGGVARGATANLLIGQRHAGHAGVARQRAGVC